MDLLNLILLQELFDFLILILLQELVTHFNPVTKDGCPPYFNPITGAGCPAYFNPVTGAVCRLILILLQELVDLQRYLTVSMKDTVPQLMTRIVTATQRVLFLLDSTILLKEDIQLNTRVFHWPKGPSLNFSVVEPKLLYSRLWPNLFHLFWSRLRLQLQPYNAT